MTKMIVLESIDKDRTVSEGSHAIQCRKNTPVEVPAKFRAAAYAAGVQVRDVEEPEQKTKSEAKPKTRKTKKTESKSEPVGDKTEAVVADGAVAEDTPAEDTPAEDGAETGAE